MPTVTKAPASAANDGAFGTIPWIDHPTSTLLAAVSSDNGVEGTVAVGVPGGSSTKGLKTGFDFAGDVPEDAGPVSVTFTVRKRGPGMAPTIDGAIRLVLAGVVQSGDHSKSGNWPTAETAFDYTFTELSAADVRAAGFGFLLVATATGPADIEGTPRLGRPCVDLISATATW